MASQCCENAGMLWFALHESNTAFEAQSFQKRKQMGGHDIASAVLSSE
jgi:hypothetical protein